LNSLAPEKDVALPVITHGAFRPPLAIITYTGIRERGNEMNPKLNKAILIALPFALMLWLLGYIAVGMLI